MSSPEEEWWEVRAGEYVLGTLDAKGRELFVRILRHDPDLQQSVRAWQTRLSPLDATTPQRTPPERVWTAIESAVRMERGDGAERAGAAISPVAPDEGLAHVELPDEPAADAGEGTDGRTRAGGRPDTEPDTGPDARANATGTADDDMNRVSTVTPLPSPPRRGLFVPFVAAFATAASLILGVLLYQQYERLDTIEGSILQADGVSVILGEDGAPLWLVQADFEGERVRVTALAPPPTGGGGDYQLWQVLPDGGGVAPVALLPQGDGESRETSAPGLVRAFDAFAVSLEPDGGSPEPTPTGAVLYQGGVTYSDEDGEP